MTKKIGPAWEKKYEEGEQFAQPRRTRAVLSPGKRSRPNPIL